MTIDLDDTVNQSAELKCRMFRTVIIECDRCGQIACGTKLNIGNECYDLGWRISKYGYGRSMVFCPDCVQYTS
jgi:hypothetical protein